MHSPTYSRELFNGLAGFMLVAYGNIERCKFQAEHNLENLRNCCMELRELHADSEEISAWLALACCLCALLRQAFGEATLDGDYPRPIVTDHDVKKWNLYNKNLAPRPFLVKLVENDSKLRIFDELGTAIDFLDELINVWQVAGNEASGFFPEECMRVWNFGKRRSLNLTCPLLNSGCFILKIHAICSDAYVFMQLCMAQQRRLQCTNIRCVSKCIAYACGLVFFEHLLWIPRQDSAPSDDASRPSLARMRMHVGDNPRQC